MATHIVAEINTSTGLAEEYLLTVSDAVEAIDSVPAFENLAAGDFVNLFTDGGVCKARLADASNGRHADGFVKTVVTAPATATVYRRGVNDQITGAPGAVHFLSATTPGKLTTTAPSGTGKYIQRIGTAKSATAIDFERVNPVGPLL